MVNGVTPLQLAKYYPRLYHMAHRGSWESIRRHGLLSTEALLDLFQVSVEQRDSILARQRPRSVSIEHRLYGRAVVRDQKPLNVAKLKSALNGCSIQQWLRMLNSRVFFWLSSDRLQTLICAREYSAERHVVVELDTLRLATDYQQSITLAPMNTGNTRPFAHPRGPGTFSRMTDYPFQHRLGRGLYYAVVELAVEGGVLNIMDYVTEAAEMRCSSCDKKENQVIQIVKKLYP